MTALLAGLLLLVAVVPPLPFTSYREVTVTPTGQTCDGQATVLRGPDWVVLSTQGRDIFIHSTDGSPDFVYFVVGSGDPIKVRTAMSIEEARRRYPDPCAFFLEVDA